MLFTELKEMDFAKEKEGAIEIYNSDFGYSDELGCYVLTSTGEPLNGKYYIIYWEEIRYFKNGKLNREDNLPAAIYKNGSLFYMVDRKDHRTDGPSRIYSHGDYYWFINDHCIDNEEMELWLTENDIPLDWNNWTESDKNKFATYWTGKFGTP